MTSQRPRAVELGRRVRRLPLPPGEELGALAARALRATGHDPVQRYSRDTRRIVRWGRES